MLLVFGNSRPICLLCRVRQNKGAVLHYLQLCKKVMRLHYTVRGSTNVTLALKSRCEVYFVDDIVRYLKYGLYYFPESEDHILMTKRNMMT